MAHAFLFGGYVQSARNSLVNLSLLPAIIGILLASLWILLGFRDWASHRAVSCRLPNGSPEKVADEFRKRVARWVFNLPAVPTSAVGIATVLLLLWLILTVRSISYGFPQLAWLASHAFLTILLGIGILVAFVPFLIFVVDLRWFPKVEAELARDRGVEPRLQRNSVWPRSIGWLVAGLLVIALSIVGLILGWW